MLDKYLQRNQTILPSQQSAVILQTPLLLVATLRRELIICLQLSKEPLNSKDIEPDSPIKALRHLSPLPLQIEEQALLLVEGAIQHSRKLLTNHYRSRTHTTLLSPTLSATYLILGVNCISVLVSSLMSPLSEQETDKKLFSIKFQFQKCWQHHIGRPRKLSVCSGLSHQEKGFSRSLEESLRRIFNLNKTHNDYVPIGIADIDQAQLRHKIAEITNKLQNCLGKTQDLSDSSRNNHSIGLVRHSSGLLCHLRKRQALFYIFAGLFLVICAGLLAQLWASQ